MGLLNYSLLCIDLVATYFPLDKVCFNNCCELVKHRYVRGVMSHCQLHFAGYRWFTATFVLLNYQTFEREEKSNSEYNPPPNLPDHH